jgi:hypothetical protein
MLCEDDMMNDCGDWLSHSQLRKELRPDFNITPTT